jgi:hypothetical protein
MNAGGAPTRADVEAHWRALLAGRTTRAEVHDWARTWVEGDDSAITDPMVRTALQHLHGFDLTFDAAAPDRMRHGPGEHHVHSPQHIADALDRWRADCAAYDADPRAFRERKRREALARLEREER